MQEKKGPNGFLVGLLIGGAFGALVSTKKGRQIMKDVVDYGLEYVGNNISMEDIDTILNQEEDEIMTGEIEKTKENTTVTSVKTHEEPARRRIFKGIKRR